MKKHAFLPLVLIALALGLLAENAGAQAVVTPKGASSTTARSGRVLTYTINGSGLSSGGGSSDVLSETHLQPGSSSQYYFSENVVDDDPNFTSTTETFVYELPGRLTVDRVHQWVYLSSGRGIKSVDMAFSTDGGASYPTTISVGDFSAPGNPASSETITFAEQTGVTHIRFTNIETFSSVQYIGCLELRFGGPISFADTASDSVTHESANITTTLIVPTTNASVTAHWWKTGDSVTNSASLGTWSNETSTNLSHTILAGLSQATEYSFVFRATNDTDDVWSATETFLTGIGGEVLAEYLFGGSVASSDSNPGTTASDVTFAGLPNPENLAYLQIGAEEIGSTFPGGSGDYFAFTLDTGINEVSLTGLEWDYGMAGGYNYQVGFFADAYLGFSGAGNYIPGTYDSGGPGVNLAMTANAVDLSGHAGFQNLSNTSVVFRVYLADGASSTSREYRYDNIRVYGTVSAPAVIDIGDASVSVSGVQTTQATVSATILNVDGDVTAYWEPGVVGDPTTYTGWDGTNGPSSETKNVAFDRTISNLTSDTLYTYALFADDGGSTDWASGTFVTALSSDEAPVFTSAVTNTYAVALNWTDNASYETGYLLQRSTNGVDYTLLASLDSNTVAYVDYVPVPGSTFYYRLAATNAAHDGSATDFALCETNATMPALDVVAEYTFDGNSAVSTDSQGDTSAADVSLGAGIATSLRGNRIECAAGEVGNLNLGGSDYFGFTLSIPGNVTATLTHFTYTYEEANSYRPAHALWSDLTGEITTPATRYQPGTTGLNGTRTLVHNLTEDGATFADLSGTNVQFRLYVGDEANSTGEQRFDDVRLYADLVVNVTSAPIELSNLSASNVSTTQATVSATIVFSDGDVTAYWEEGVVADPAVHTGWDGTDGPGAETKDVPFDRTVSGLVADTLYTYAFYATNALGSNDWAAATLVTHLSSNEAPVFTSAIVDELTVTLNWADNASYETGYLLQRSTNGVAFAQHAALDSNTTSYTESVPPNATYTYRLAATNSGYGGSATDFALCETSAAVPTPSLEVLAEYKFDADDPASSDTQPGTDADDVSPGAGISGTLQNQEVRVPATATLKNRNLANIIAANQYVGFSILIPAGSEVTFDYLTYTYREINAYQPIHALFSDLTGGFVNGAQITTPDTVYSTTATGLNGTHTRVLNLTEAGATFEDLSGTTVEFRFYIGDGANSTGTQAYDDIRLYGSVSTATTTFMFR